MFLLAQAANPTVVAGGQLDSVWDFVVKGGPTMVVTILCSLLALTIIVERLIVLRRRAVMPPPYLERLNAAQHEPQRALEMSRDDGSPIANIVVAGLMRRADGVQAVEKAVEDAGRRELVRLRQRMRVLGALPQVATMLGLLGTIFGMIKTFQAVAASGQSLGKTEMLARGIFEAWTNTAAGLLVAIPVLVAYHALLGRIDMRIVEMDRFVVDWIEQNVRRTPVRPRVAEASREAVSAPPPVVAHAQSIAPIPEPAGV